MITITMSGDPKESMAYTIEGESSSVKSLILTHMNEGTDTARVAWKHRNGSTHVWSYEGVDVEDIMVFLIQSGCSMGKAAHFIKRTATSERKEQEVTA
jgi:hypothetical protein